MIKTPNFASLITALFISTSFLSEGWSQENEIKVNTDWDHERHAWAASWVTHPSASRTAYGVFNLRNLLTIESIPDSLVVYVSADNRYRLFVNGIEVSSGPARGSLMHWRYETVDIAPYLVKGENVLAAEVFNMGEYRPAAQFSYQTAFIFQAEGPWGATLNTPGKWLIHQNLAYNPIEVTSEVVRGYYVAGPTDRIRGSEHPWGWETLDFDDTQWSVPAVITRGVGRGYMHGVPWMLVPRNIPQMEQRL
jgi:alpha-L-rhamnosidase